MTVNVESALNSYPLAGLAEAAEYVFTFTKIDDADLTVTYISGGTGNSYSLVLGVDFSVDTLIDKIVITAAGETRVGLVNAGVLQITRNIAVTQTTDLINGGPFNVEIYEQALDKLTLLIQDLDRKYLISAATRISSSDANGAYGLLAHDGAGTFTVPELSYVQGTLTVDDNGQTLYNEHGITELSPTSGTFSVDSGIWENQPSLIARYHYAA
jgi:hypothetical protein